MKQVTEKVFAFVGVFSLREISKSMQTHCNKKKKAVVSFESLKHWHSLEGRKGEVPGREKRVDKSLT